MATAFTFTPHHEEHSKPGHPERPERLNALLDTLQNDEVWGVLQHVDAAPASLESVELVHTSAYIERLQKTTGQPTTQLDADTYATASSLKVALRALGGLLGITRAVLDEEVENGFAAIRPPGHHATPSHSMGFCLLSNAALAARWAQRAYGVERVLIVDFDVHHGNGTQDVFYDDPDVLYMSVHQDPLYPGTGKARETGRDGAEGTTVNVPLPPSTGGPGYLAAFRQVLAPLAHRFRPELIFLSAGYDAHWKDPLAQMNLTAGGFARLVREVMEWADACCSDRLVATLEGGYHAEALARSACGTVRRLVSSGAQVDDLPGAPPAAEPGISNHLSDLAALHDVA